MANAEDFIKKCQKIVSEFEAGKKALVDAASQINSSTFEYPFDGPAHPMVYKVADLAFDITEDYRSDKEDKADWASLTKTLSNYVDGNWEPTCWILSAMYGEYNNNILIHSYSIAVRRQNGETEIESANEKIKDALRKVINKLNSEQTDERYLQNLARLTPKAIGKYNRASVEVKEYLTEPYYSTAG